MRPDERGFSLIELVVVVGIIGVLAAVALPGMRDYLDRHRLVSQIRVLADLASLGRSEAIMHSAVTATGGSKQVSMTISPITPWYVGLANGNTACSGSTCVINQAGTSVSHTVFASACSECAMVSPTSQQLVVFDFRGIVTGGADQAITLKSPLGKQLSLTISRLGRISICVPSGSVPIVGYTSC